MSKRYQGTFQHLEDILFQNLSNKSTSQQLYQLALRATYGDVTVDSCALICC